MNPGQPKRSTKPFPNYYIFGALLLIYCLSLCIKFKTFSGPAFFSNYLADLVCMPIVLFLSKTLIRQLPRFKDLHLSSAMIAFVCLYFIVAFEIVLPRFDKKFTADIFDAFTYFLGAVGFWWMQKRGLL